MTDDPRLLAARINQPQTSEAAGTRPPVVVHRGPADPIRIRARSGHGGGRGPPGVDP
jgi:hypothetical protein